MGVVMKTDQSASLVVPSIVSPHSDAGPVPTVGRSHNLVVPGKPGTHGGARRRARPDIFNTHSTGTPPFLVVPSIVSPHSDAGSVPTVGHPPCLVVPGKPGTQGGARR